MKEFPTKATSAEKETQQEYDEENRALPVLDIAAIRNVIESTGREFSLSDDMDAQDDDDIDVEALLRSYSSEITPGSSEMSVRQIEMLKELTGTPEGPKVYLGSAVDTSLAEVYGKQEVIHVDMDEGSIDALKQAGYMGKSLDYESYAASLAEGETIGLLYSRNSGAVPDSLIDRLADGGLIVANNYHSSADDIAKKKGFELLGASDDYGQTLLSPEEANNAFGSAEYAIGPEAKMIIDPDEIEKVRDDPEWTVDGAQINPDYLWVFRKTGEQ